MRLTPEQSRVLRMVECQADASMLEISRATRLKPHVVRYILDRFQESGLIRERLFINTYRLGYTRYSLFFSLPGQKGAARQELIRKLQQHERVALILELGGAFQFEINILVRETFELQEFLHWFSQECGDALAGKAVGVQLSHRLFGVKCLWPESKTVRDLSYQVERASVGIDEVDHGILTRYSSGPYTMREVGQELGISPSTVEQRLKRLRKEGVIVGSTHVIEYPPLLNWVLLIHMNGLEKQLRDEAIEFARKHPLIHYSVECLGTWDMELGVVSEDSRAPTQVLEDLYKRFGSRISRADALPIFNRHKVVDYPITTL